MIDSKGANKAESRRQLIRGRWFRAPVFRSPDKEQERHSTWLESFFDLIFASAVANLALAFSRNYSWQGLGAMLLALVPIIWCWIGQTFYSTRFDTDDLWQRLVVALMIAAVGGMAVFAPTLLGAGGKGFVLSFAACRILLICEYLRAARHVPQARRMSYSYSAGFFVAVLIWLVSFFSSHDLRPIFWVCGIVFDYLVPTIFVKQTVGLPVHLAHIPERFGLFTLILLGDLIASVISTLDMVELTVRSVVAAAVCLVIGFALWWDYFEGAGAANSRQGQGAGRRAMGSFRLWMYGHIPYAAALVTVGAGARDVILSSDPHHGGAHQMGLICIGSLTVLLMTVVFWYTASSRFGKHELIKLAKPYLLISGLPLGGLIWQPQWGNLGELSALAGIHTARVCLQIYHAAIQRGFVVT